MTVEFDGGADPDRRAALDAGAEDLIREGWRRYRKTVPTWARRMSTSFTVTTIEGTMTGQPGDYLACGAQGEMYPIAAHIFAETFEPFDDA